MSKNSVPISEKFTLKFQFAWVMQQPTKQHPATFCSRLFNWHGRAAFYKSKMSVFQIAVTMVCRILPRFAISTIFHGRMYLPKASGLSRQIEAFRGKSVHMKGENRIG